MSNKKKGVNKPSVLPRLLKGCCSLPVVMLLLVRSIDFVYFNVAFCGIISSEYIIFLTTVFAVAILFASSIEPMKTTLATTVLFAVLKKYADDIPIPSVSFDEPLVSIITGANSGIGYAVAEELARQGNIVYLACRSEERCTEARTKLVQTLMAENSELEEDLISSKVFAVPGMDLSNPHQMRKYVNGMLIPKIDLMVLNAGFIPSGNFTSQGSGWESGMGDMHLGHFAMLTFFKEAGLVDKQSTTVVAVSSDMMRFGGFHDSLLVEKGEGDLKGEITTGILPTPIPTRAIGFLNAMSYLPDHFSFGSYSRVKLANVFFARELERRGWVKRAVSVHPGTVQTSIVLLDGWLSEAQQLLSPLFLRAPRIAANVVLTAAISKPDMEDVVSKAVDINHKYPADKWLHYANGQGVICPRTCVKFKSYERNDAVAKALWSVSETTLKDVLAKPPPPPKKKTVIKAPLPSLATGEEVKQPEIKMGLNEGEDVSVNEVDANEAPVELPEEEKKEEEEEFGFTVNEFGEVIVKEVEDDDSKMSSTGDIQE